MRSFVKSHFRIVFHGPEADKDCRRAVTKFAKTYGGKFSYTCFTTRGRIHSEDTIGKAAYCAVVPAANIWKARRMVRGVKAAGLEFRLMY